MSFAHLGRAQLEELLEEVLAKAQQARNAQSGREVEHLELVHELRAYQLELEMQNRELRDAQLEVERSRDRYAELYEHAPVAFLTLDAEHRVHACNRRAAALLLRPVDQIVGEPLAQLLDALDPALLQGLLGRAAEGRIETAGELEVHIGGGPRRLALFVESGSDLEPSGGSLRCALLDVTARARAEAERDRAFAAERALHERFEALDRLNVAIANVLSACDRASEDAVLSTVLAQAIAWLDAESAEIAFAGEPSRARAERPGRDASLVRTIDLGVPIRLGNKSLGRLEVTFAKAQGSLEDLQRTLELIAERLALALITARLNRAEADERERLALLEQVGGELASCNDQASTQAGVARVLAAVVPAFATAAVLWLQDEQGLRVLEAVHVEPARRDALAQFAGRLGAPLARRAQAAQGTLVQPISALGASEQVARMLGFTCVTAIPLTVRGASLGLLAFGYDDARTPMPSLIIFEQVSDRCALALDAARLLEELRTAVASRDTLLAIVSHDLRSPLNAIALTAGMLGGARHARSGEADSAQIELIKGSVARMAALVEDLVSAANLDAGNLRVNPTPNAPAQLVREACMLSAPLIEAMHLVIEQRCASSLPEVAADRARVLQVLINLLGNAIKFTPAGGKLSVRAEQREQRVRFAVSDTGPGIAPADLPRVFGRYWTSGTAHHSGQGLGLGLFIAERIVAAHGGRIWVESTLGAGACFYFELPLAQSSRDSQVLARVANRAQG